jgi:drug/metabolite transporter (DMT)-like permease
MLVATTAALAAAVLHAAWNLAAKRSTDRFVALWGQFLAAAAIGLPILLVTRAVPWEGWAWASVSGLIHTPYLVGLARAYDHGDFSVAYPLARGGGALAAAIGGVLLLGDDLGVVPLVAVVTVVAGMALLSVGAAAHEVAAALLVAVTIGAYTVVDSHAARLVDSATYVCASFLMSAVFLTIWAATHGRVPSLRAALPAAWPRLVAAGATSLLAYALVLVAVRRAPVGYVAALRESSVLVAVVAGWRLLDEGRVVQRMAAAALILGGLVLLVTTA